MKKLAVLFLSALLVFGLAACGGSGGGGDKTIKVGVAIYRFDDNFMTLYREELEKYFNDLSKGGVKYDVTIVDGQFNQDTQTGQIDNFISQQVDVIIVNLVQNSAAATIVNKCKEAEIPVVLINREPENADDMQIWPGKQAYVGADAKVSGTIQGKIIADLPDKGDLNANGKVDYIMIIGDPDNSDARFRTEFSIKALTDAGIEVNMLGEKVCNWQATEAQPAVADFLSKFPNKQIDVVFCNNDGMAMGALASIEAAGLEVGKDIYLVGVDAIPEAVDAVKAGKMTGTVLNDHIGQSHKAADVAIELANGKDVETYYWVDYVAVN